MKSEDIRLSLWERHQRDKLPHALLFLGAAESEKKQVAQSLAHALLCAAPNVSGKPCGECKGCHLVNAKSHPDLRWVEPEEAGHAIKIDQVREVVHFVSETALLGGYRIIILSPATAMNIASANALLKTLEEPTPKTILILICEHSARLPATIISRCQKVNFYQSEKAVEMADPEREEFYQVLQQLSQKKLDPLGVAAKWLEKDIKWIVDSLWLQAKSILQIKLINGETVSPELLKYIEHLQKVYSQVLSSLNLNRQLLLEELFIRWSMLL